MAGKKYLGPYSENADIATKEKLDALSGFKYLKFICSRSSGTSDGTFTSGAWRTRTLTTEVNDDTGSASLASNRFTLPAGTYVIRASAPAYRVHQHMAALFNYTDSSYTLYGTSEFASVDNALITRSFVVGKFTITAAKAFEIRHYCNTTRADNGFGPANGIGVNETYTVVELWKVA